MAIPPISPYPIPTPSTTLPADCPARSWALEPARAALLVHDMQKYFLAAYDWNKEPLHSALANIARLITTADQLGIPVFYSAQPPQQHPTRRGLLSDMWGQGLQTAEEASIIKELAPGKHHQILTKWRYSAFERTDLYQSLAFARRDQLIITGVYGHMGCKVTAVDAFMKDIQPFVITDGIADFTAQDHQETIDWVAKRCGRSLDTASALKQLEVHDGPPSGEASGPPSFVMSDSDQTLTTCGVKTRYGTVEQATAALRRAAEAGREDVVVGALPFDPDTAPVLLAPESFQRHAGAPRWKTAPLVPDVVDISQRPSLQEHGQRVSRAVEAIGRGEFQKVVLSREEEYTLASPVEPEALLRGFMETSATGHGHLVATTNGPEEAFFVGSSPELLIRKEGARIVSHPLAGTIARSEDPVTDWARAIELTLSHKDIAEHRFVTTAIRKVLEPLCTQLHVPELPTLTATSHTWHLGTHIEGTLRNPDTSVLELAALLHPTPAVNGAPSAAALDFLRQQEPERGLYGGAIGYADSHGDGEWRVAIRSATVQGSQVSARAGGGIVAESQPDQEIEETNFKLGPVRALLGLAAKGETEGTAQPPSAHIAPNPEPHLSPLNGSHGPEVLANHMPRTLAQEYHRQGIWTHHTHWDVFQQTVATFPNRPATTDGHRSLSWHELDNSVETAAHYLHQAGVRRGDGCILQLPNSVVFLETLLALWKLGAIPIFALPDLGSTEVRHFASHAPARFYISTSRPDRHLAGVHATLQEPLDDGRTVRAILIDETAESPWATESTGHSEAANEESPAPPTADVEADELAFLQLSGGTTGLPKLIPRTHADYLYSIRCALQACDLETESCLLVALPAAHNFTLSSPGILGALLRGAHIVFAKSPMPSDLLPAIDRHGATHLALVPPSVLGILHAPARDRHDLRTLRTLWVGGAKLSAEVARRIRPELDCQLQQVFGMAEGLVNFTPLNASTEEIINTQGRPMSSHDEICIVDDATLPLPEGHPGHLLTRGPYTIRGYHRAEEINSRAFTEDGFYITGDIVTVDDSALTVVGRAKDQINRGGEKVAPEAVENALLSHPDIHDVSVVGTPDDNLGEAITAYVILRDGVDDLTPLAVRKHARAAGIARFAVPDHVHIVEEFPTTGVGKVNKRIQQNNTDSTAERKIEVAN